MCFRLRHPRPNLQEDELTESPLLESLDPGTSGQQDCITPRNEGPNRYQGKYKDIIDIDISIYLF